MTPCGACKYQKRRCLENCPLAPHFPPESIQRFAYVHHVFGGGNVTNMLRSTRLEWRKWVVRALAYQAEARVRDPVHGCVGAIQEQEEKLRILKEKLQKAQRELAQYVGPGVVRQVSPSYYHLQSSSVTVDFDDLRARYLCPDLEPTPSSPPMQPPQGDGDNVNGKSVDPPS